MKHDSVTLLACAVLIKNPRKGTTMRKIHCITPILFAALTSMMAGCLEPEGDSADTLEESNTAEAALATSQVNDSPDSEATVELRGEVGGKAPTASLGVDWRICWPVAGLYNEACGSSVRENMSSGTAIEYAGSYAWCGSEYWYYVTNLWTGHHGWVRTGALC